MIINKKNKNNDIVIIDYGEKNEHNYIKYIIIGVAIIVVIFFIFILKILVTKKTTYSISLKGNKEITIYVGTEFTEPGYVAYDNYGNDNTEKLRVINTIDTNKVGTYEMAYIIGNTIAKRKINVIQEKDSKTVIHLKGSSIQYYEIGTEYKEPGYIAIDTIDGDITNKVVVSGIVDSSKKGPQKIIYTVENSKGVVTSITRTIIMSESSIVLSLNNNNYTKNNVIINVGIIDNKFSYLLLPNGQKIESKTYQYEVSENGTYTFIKHNNNGDEKKETITVKNIDRISPTGSCKAEVGENTKVIINAKDNVGVKYYKYNGKNYYSNEFSINEKLTSVKVSIYDNANNETKITCSIKKVSTNPPKTETPAPTSDPKPKSSSVNTPRPKSSSVNTPRPKSSSVNTSKPKSSSVNTPKPSSSSVNTPKPKSSSVKPSNDTYDTICNTYSCNKHIGDFLAMFEGADKTEYSNGFECNNGTGYIIKDIHDGALTTAYGLTNLSIKDDSNPNGVYPCDTMSSSNTKYFTQSYFKEGKCLPKDAVREALVCKINYDKKYINNRLKKCTNGVKLTKQQMAALVDYGNSGIGYLKKVMDAYCNAIESGKSISKAEDAMFKKIFAKEGQGNRHGNCKYIKRRECEAALYFNGNYTCYGQNIYSDKPFNYRFKKYHDSGYSCTK